MDRARANEVLLKVLKRDKPKLVESNKDKDGFELFRMRVDANVINIKNTLKEFVRDVRLKEPNIPDDLLRTFVSDRLMELNDNIMDRRSLWDKIKACWNCWRIGISVRESIEALNFFMFELIEEVLKESA